MARLSELIREGITATTLGPCVKKALSFCLGADSTASPMLAVVPTVLLPKPKGVVCLESH
jgi:hypothetical protein